MSRYFLIIVILILAGCPFIHAQKLQPDELKKAWATLRKPMADTARAKLYLKLAESHSYDPFPELDSALYYCNLGRALSQSINFQWGIATSDATASDAYRKKGDRKNGQEMLARAKERSEKHHLTEVLIEAYLTMGWYWPDEFNDKDYLELALQTSIRSKNQKEEQRTLIFMSFRDSESGNYRMAAERRLRALELSKTSGVPFDERAYTSLCSSYLMIGNFEAAIKYGLEGIRMSEQSSDTTNVFLRANLYNFLGKTYYSLRQYEKALVNFRKAVEIGGHYKQYVNLTTMICNISSSLSKLKRYDDALKALNTMSALYPAVNELDSIDFDLSYIEVYVKINKIKEAIPHFRRVEKQYIKSENDAVWVGTPLIEYCIAAGMYDKAQQYLYSSRPLYKKQNMATDYRTSFRLQFTLDSIRGHYVDAIRHYQRYKAIGDSLSEKQRAEQIKEIEIIYETQKKDQNIQSLTHQALLQQALSDRKDRDLQLREQDIVLLSRDRALQEALGMRKDQDLNLLRQKQQLQEAAANKKEQDILLLTNEARLRNNELHTATLTRNVTIAGVMLLAILIGLLYNRYQLKQRNNREISDKNQALQQLVTEKEWLVKEVHHRVKNNLQTIVSLLRSQSQFLNNSDALHALLDSQNRVHAMSLIHQKLYLHDSDTSINLANYLHDLVRHLNESLGTNHIYFRVHIAPIELDVTKAVPVGLIVNEAVTNSIKYAFRHTANERNEISLNVALSDDQNITLVIADNGIGLPPDFDADKRGGLGLMLIHGLAKDIDAELTIASDHGLKIQLVFSPEVSAYQFGLLPIGNASVR